MAKITKINHVAIAVADVDAALSFWQDAMGIALHHVEDVPSQNSVVAFLPVGESEVELVKPTTPIAVWRSSWLNAEGECTISALRWMISKVCWQS